MQLRGRGLSKKKRNLQDTLTFPGLGLTKQLWRQQRLTNWSVDETSQILEKQLEQGWPGPGSSMWTFFIDQAWTDNFVLPRRCTVTFTGCPLFSFNQPKPTLVLSQLQTWFSNRCTDLGKQSLRRKTQQTFMWQTSCTSLHIKFILFTQSAFSTRFGQDSETSWALFDSLHIQMPLFDGPD